jgi:hypothetical protein
MKRQATIDDLRVAIERLAVVIWPAKAWETVGSTRGPYRSIAFRVDTERKPIVVHRKQLALPFGERAPWGATLRGRRLEIVAHGKTETAALRALLIEVIRRAEGAA